MSVNTSTLPWRLTPALALGLAALAACAGDHEPARSGPVTCPPGMRRAAGQDICIHGLCGNGVVDADEACDDGNRIAGDGCSPDCQSAEVCGNGIVDPAMGEVCDDGNTDPDDECCSDCRSCPELATEPPPPAGPAAAAAPCPRAELEQALAELSELRARAQEASAQAAEAGERARAALRRAKAQSRAAVRARRKRAHVARELKQALDLLAELERANSALNEALAAEREQNGHLLERLARVRSTALD